MKACESEQSQAASALGHARRRSVCGESGWDGVLAAFTLAIIRGRRSGEVEVEIIARAEESYHAFVQIA
eukprot:913033-Pleurochrysis_carterae.AAC.1